MRQRAASTSFLLVSSRSRSATNLLSPDRAHFPTFSALALMRCSNRKSRSVWQLFCMFRDLKWHIYEPFPESPDLREGTPQG